MCGIAGIMTADGEPPAAAALQAMSAALAHRGPDGTGHYRAGDVGMVQTRLAIIDLVTGDQPLYESGGAALMANGEIYNYIELRAELGGVGFSSASDCEPPLHLYRRHGLDFTERLRGMYAIALHDPAAGRLILARDPFGIKPLYYAETAAGFAFASEPQALDRRRAGAGAARAPGAQRAAAAPIHHGTRDHLRRHSAGAAGRDRGGGARPRRRAPPPRGDARRGGAAAREVAGAAGIRPRLRRFRAAASAFGRALWHVPVRRRRQLRRAGDDGAAQRAAGEGLHRGVHHRPCGRRARAGPRGSPVAWRRACRGRVPRSGFLAAAAGDHPRHGRSGGGLRGAAHLQARRGGRARPASR